MPSHDLYAYRKRFVIVLFLFLSFFYHLPRASESRKKQLQWSNEDMIAAMSAVHDQKVTISDAATKYSVPRKTLDDRIRERVEYGSRPGPSTVLIKEEEDGLASYLAYMAQRGFPLTQTLTKAFLPGP